MAINQWYTTNKTKKKHLVNLVQVPCCNQTTQSPNSTNQDQVIEYHLEMKHLKILAPFEIRRDVDIITTSYSRLYHSEITQAHDVKTLYGRHFNVLTSHQHPYNVVLTSCAGWIRGLLTQ